MTQAEMVKLLGRSLTSTEATNFDLYLDIATMQLEDLLCTPLESVTETRVFDTREGYSTAFVNIFNAISEVKLNDEVVTNYSIRQWDKRNASWYNSLVFTEKFDSDDTIEVTADWGFVATSGDDSDYPVDLQLLLAKLFGFVSSMKNNGNIKSKRIEDYMVTFNEYTEYQQFCLDNKSTINKYGLCDEVYVRHGDIC